MMSVLRKTSFSGWRLGMVAGLALLVGACSSTPDVAEFDDTPAPTLYNEALSLMDQGRFKNAAEKFEEVDRQHPYSEFAEKAILLSSFAYFRAGEFDDSQSSARRFLSLHPGSEEAPYAQFLIAQSHYNQISDIGRDQSEAIRALGAYREITRLYPESKYALESQRRQDELLNHLAGKEMEVGRFYMGRQNYLAAINRFRVVVSEYQSTQHVEEALLRLVEANLALGIVNEAQTAGAVLGHNYPDSPWYRDAYQLLADDGLSPRNDGGSWLGRNWRRLRS